jgi:hypothetical protein
MQTLKLIKHAAQRGSPELRRALARHSSSVRDLTHFKCAPDPFKGDIPWKRVQEYAREALDTLHAAPGTQNSSSFTSTGLGSVGASGKRMQGFGNDSGGGGGGTSSSSGMLGFGSDSVGYQYGGGSGSNYGDVGSNAASYRAPISGGGGGLDLSSGGAVLESLSYGMRDLTDRAVEAFTRPEHHRLNSVDSEDSGHGYGINYNTNMSFGSRAPVMLDRSPVPSPSTSSSQQQQQSSREYRLVDKICTPSGMRAAPSSEDLNKFIDAAAALDGVELALALQHKLEIGSWQETLRALCAIEALLEKSSTSPTAGEVAVHFQAGVGVIRRAQQSTQATVRQRAQLVLKLLGADTLPEESSGGSAVKAVAAATPDLLLGGDEVDLNTLDIAPAPAAAVGVGLSSSTNNGVSNSNAMDLLAGLHVAPEQSGGSDIFGDWADSTAATMPVLAAAQAPAPAAASVSGAGGIDLLDGFNDLTIAQPPVARSTAPAMPAVHSAGPLDDIFSMASPPAAAFPPATAPFSNGMGNISMQYQQPSVSFNSSGIGNSVAPLSGQQQQQHVRTVSLGGGGGGSGVNDDVLRAINAATSGISSTKREEVAFDFVTTAMAQLKTKK